MADKASDGLPYGQVGRAVYHIEHGAWAFSRTGTPQRRLLRSTAPTETIAKPTAKTRVSPAGADSRDPPSRRREKQSKALLQSVPELQSASDILPEYARVSEAIEEASSHINTSQGQIIALGEIYDESKRCHVGAIALPSGPTGSNLRIIEGLQQRQGWDGDRSSWIESLNFSGAEGRWDGPGVSILSIVFAQPLERGGHYLAVRLQTETLIFRPVLRKHAVAGCSRLDPNLLFTIGTDETRHLPHAYMTFNPWFTGQLAMVDQAGRWCIWETGRNSSEATRIRSGSTHDDITQTGLEDGWARIAWVESASTLCIAARRKLVLTDLEAVNETGTVEVDVGLKKSMASILDLRTLPALLTHVFVLTSTHVWLYNVKRAPDRQILPILALQVRHYRNPEDVSLRMNLCTGAGGNISYIFDAVSCSTDPQQMCF